MQDIRHLHQENSRQERSQKQVENEFLAAYDQYADALYRHCFFRAFSKVRAEELVQETFLRAWQYLEKGKTIDNHRAFLYRIANNLLIDESRKKKETSLDVLLEESPANEPIYDGKERMEIDVLSRDVVEALQQLPDESRLVLTMRYIDDLDPREIAEILGVTANVVSVRINRATTMLRSLMNK